MIRYTSLGAFATPSFPERFLRQASLPILDFVLSSTQVISNPLRLSPVAEFSLSVIGEITLTLVV